MFLSGGMLYAAYLFIISKTIDYKKLLVSAILLIVVLSVLSFSLTSLPMKNRLPRTLGLFSGNYEMINNATAMRLPIWETGLIIFKAHWINGVGARGFRYVYKAYAPEDNFWITENKRKPGTKRNGVTHPHLIILEIVTETGVIGLVGYLLFWIVLFSHVRSFSKQNSTYGVPWLITIMVATLPYNAHLAFYGSYWSSAIWWVIPFFIVCTRYQNKPPGQCPEY